jgi:hypothetical protein
LANRSGVSRVDVMIHFVSPSVVFAVHSKNISVFGEKLFQLLNFSVA